MGKRASYTKDYSNPDSTSAYSLFTAAQGNLGTKKYDKDSGKSEKAQYTRQDTNMTTEKAFQAIPWEVTKEGLVNTKNIMEQLGLNDAYNSQEAFINDRQDEIRRVHGQDTWMDRINIGPLANFIGQITGYDLNTGQKYVEAEKDRRAHLQQQLSTLEKYRADLRANRANVQQNILAGQLKDVVTKKFGSVEDMMRMLTSGQFGGGVTPYQQETLGLRRKDDLRADLRFATPSTEELQAYSRLQTNLPAVKRLLESAPQNIPAWGSDFFKRAFTPGAATWFSKKAGVLDDKEEAFIQDLNKYLQFIVKDYQLAISGRASTNEEKADLERIIGRGAFTTDRELRTALNILSKSAKKSWETITGKAGKDVQKQVWDNVQIYPSDYNLDFSRAYKISDEKGIETTPLKGGAGELSDEDSRRILDKYRTNPGAKSAPQ